VLGLIADLVHLLAVPSLGLDSNSGLHHWYMDRKTQDWPSIPMTSVSWIKGPSRPTISFTYVVGNERYGGWQEVRAQKPEPRLVRYDPKRPERFWVP
jgi:hypothetical protein